MPVTLCGCRQHLSAREAGWIRIDGKDVTDPDQLGQLIREHQPGDQVTVGVVHADGSQGEVTVTLGTNPAATT